MIAFRILVVLAVVGFALSGCNTADDANNNVTTPNIVLNSTNGAIVQNDTVFSGDAVSFNVAFSKGTDGQELRKVQVWMDTVTDGSFVPVPIQYVNVPAVQADNYNDASNVDFYGTINPNNEEFNLLVTNFPVIGLTGERRRFRFRVEDRDGNTQQRIVTIHIGDSINPQGPPKAFSYTFADADYVPFFLNVTDSGAIVPAASVGGAAVELYYFQNINTLANFVSATEAGNALLGTDAVTASSGVLTNVRTTSLTATDFTNLVDQSDLDDNYNTGGGQLINGWNQSITPPATAAGNDLRVNNTYTQSGDVFAFRTTAGKHGLLLLVHTGTQTTFYIKVQQ
jgi:hypothetical protein